MSANGMDVPELLPALTREAAERIRALGPGERDLFTGDADMQSKAYLMSLRTGRAYRYARPRAEGREVLELGCGSGSGAVYLSRVAKRFVALDVEEALVAMLPEIWPRTAVEWRGYPGGRLPFEDESFDLVVSFQAVEHVDDPRLFLAEARRVLRPGGRAIMTTPNRLLRVAPFQRPWNPYHVREFWAWQLKRLFRGVGFREISVQGLRSDFRIARPEYVRSLKQMLGGWWMLLPGFFRRALKRVLLRKPASPASAGATDAPAPTRPAAVPPGPETYRWERGGLALSLDLMIEGVK